jgi:biotin synthase
VEKEKHKMENAMERKLTMDKFIQESAARVLAGEQLGEGEALGLAKVSGADLLFLLAYGGKIKEQMTENQVDLCSIISARTGSCSEDCAFCAQSASHSTGIKEHDLLDEELILAKAQKMASLGAHRFDIVISGRGVKHGETDFEKIIKILQRIRKETGLDLCACLGTLTDAGAQALKEAGVTRYNHNLETARSFFPKIVTTHTYEERLETVRAVKKAGMEICCGGIIGLGETMAQRIELALTLRELEVEAIPINILNPISGTPLAGQKILNPWEVLKTIAIFRFLLPTRNIRYAGGREKALGELQPLGIMAGLNGMLIGGYLTTPGTEVEQDLAMLKSFS